VNSLTDSQLLRAYAEERSEAAFGVLVQRHVDLVYSAALRMVRDPHLAEDVTQAVFVALAQKGRQPADRPVLAGWLHRTAQHLAAKTVRSDVRRHVREKEAAAMNQLVSPEPDLLWEQAAPHLDAALGDLTEPDRDALLLRYFQRKTAREVGQALGVSEEAAHKRVSRAVERLRALLAKRGIAVGAGGLVALISANAVHASPAGLAATVSTAAALAGAAVPASTALAAAKTIAMTTLQKTLVAATLALAAGTGLCEARQAAQLRQQNQALAHQEAPLADQIRQLQHQLAEATNQLAALAEQSAASQTNSAELLKLRGEATRLRRASQELAQLKTDASSDGTQTAKSWAGRVALLKQRLAQTPEAAIPELRYLTDEDWLNCARGQLDSEADYRRALGALRNTAEEIFATKIRTALKSYLRANGGKMPADLSQLQPYFDPPADEAALQRWEVAPAKTIPLNMGTDVIITQRAAVDDVFDTRLAIGPDGLGSRPFLSPETTPVYEAYRAAHNGQWPDDVSELQPYATTPEQQAAFQKLLLKKAAGITQP
jgi:RNA polymerase sigma factor (sigma-70 family)